MASDKPFNYDFGLWLLLSQKYSKLQIDSIEDSEVHKIDFADLVKDAKSVAGFYPSRQFRVGGMTSHKHGLVPRQFRDEFLQDSGHFRG